MPGGPNLHFCKGFIYIEIQSSGSITGITKSDEWHYSIMPLRGDFNPHGSREHCASNQRTLRCDIVINPIKLISFGCRAETISGEGGAAHRSMMAVATHVGGIAIKRIVGNQTLG